MCGIAGYWYFNQEVDNPDLILGMSAEIRHRGPDDEGIALINWKKKEIQEFSTEDSQQQIQKRYRRVKPGDRSFCHDSALAHRRFAIIDLTPMGHQPMWNEDKSIGIVYNGEIFNYIELRSELEQKGKVFHSQSDTEVILMAYQCWGLEAFRKFSGFWALSVVDLNQKLVILSRDRIGKKPLYFYRDDTRMIWASEIKSILKILAPHAPEANDEVIFNYLVSGIKDVNHSTFWKDIRMLDNASIVVVKPDGSWSTRSYWKIPDKRLSKKEIGLEYALGNFRNILEKAIKERLRADVPVAFELSGGLDSSSLVAFRSVLQKDGFSAFTIKYDDPGVDESEFAQELASNYTNIHLHQINFEEENLWNYLNDFIYLLEEPFHGPVLLIGQLLRKRMKEKGFKVIIGGAGGDEVFAGYTEYAIPALRSLLGSHQYGEFFKNLLFYKEKYPLGFLPLTGLVMRKVLKLKGDRDFYTRYINSSKEYPFYLKYPKDINTLFIENMNDLKMYYWMSSNDKCDMGIPIEVRNPLLDFRVVDFVFSLPISYFIHDGWLKWFLRKAFQDILPHRIAWRKQKKGFPFPLSRWLLLNEGIIKKCLKNQNNQWVTIKNVLPDFNYLAEKRPDFLWRMINLQLWHSLYISKEKFPISNPLQEI